MPLCTYSLFFSGYSWIEIYWSKKNIDRLATVQCSVENLWYLAFIRVLKNPPKHSYGQSGRPNSTGLPHGSPPPLPAVQ